jgi:hypothetical protein
MKHILTIIACLFLVDFESFSQQTLINTPEVPIYKSTLFERQLIQRSVFSGPNLITGKYSGQISDYDLANGMGYFKFDTYSAPKPIVYGNIIRFNTDINKNLKITEEFKKKYLSLWILFQNTFKFSYGPQKILNKNDYLKYVDSLDSLVSPFYSAVNIMGKTILDSTENQVSLVYRTNSQIKKNSSLDKISANKFWDRSYNLFDAFTDKPVKLNLLNNSKYYSSYYKVFVYNDTDDIDSLITYYNSEIKKGVNPKEVSGTRGYSIEELSLINGVKFESIDNFYQWARLKYPGKFPNNQSEILYTNNQPKSSNVEKQEPSQTKNLEAFAAFMRAGSSSNNSTKQNNSSSNSSSNTSKNPTTPQKKCSSCSGTGKCGKCGKTQQDGYYNIGGSYVRISEVRLGMIICKSCHGYGLFMKKPCGFCQSKGWEFCPECNYNGKGSNVGQCRTCKGSGSSK